MVILHQPKTKTKQSFLGISSTFTTVSGSGPWNKWSSDMGKGWFFGSKNHISQPTNCRGIHPIFGVPAGSSIQWMSSGPVAKSPHFGGEATITFKTSMLKNDHWRNHHLVRWLPGYKSLVRDFPAMFDFKPEGRSLNIRISHYCNHY